MSLTSAYEVGQQVRAVKGPRNTMNPVPMFVGQVGSIALVMPPVDGMPYYEVAFEYGTDWVDHCNLEVV